MSSGVRSISTDKKSSVYRLSVSLPAMWPLYFCTCALFLGFSSTSAAVSPSTKNIDVVQELCDKMVERYNGFVDIVPLIMPVTFPKENDYFIGNAEMFFYNADTSTNRANCTMFTEQDVKLLRIEVALKMEIKSNGHRMKMDNTILTAHLRLQTYDDRMAVRPQLVDVLVPGQVLQDGKPLSSSQAEEILRPLLVKVFSDLAERFLHYDDWKASAVFIDSALAVKLFKQIFLSYLAQI